MKFRDDIERLEWLNQRRMLALFVGAGVSRSCGLPSWNELIAELAQRAWGKDAANSNSTERDNLRTARALRVHFGGDFENQVNQIIYSKQIEYSDLLLSIPDTGISRICNFNFDHLLEAAFQMRGVAYDVALPGTKYDQLQLRPIIFHPHGFLEYSGASSAITFSENDYHNLYSDPYCWSNLIQINLLSNYSALFVGVSLTDPNLRRLIDASRKIHSHPHFAIFKKRDDLQDIALSRDLNSLGVTPIWVHDYSNIASIFERILRVFESKKQRNARRAHYLNSQKRKKKRRQIELLERKLAAETQAKNTKR